jgi:5,5'-dehydrodivanillate O-demethylase oxygenase subunit
MATRTPTRNGSAARTTHTDFDHVGPGTLAGRYLRRFWHPVYRAKDLRPGQAVPIRILGEDFTLYRGASGTPHVIGPRCAHRATQLSTGWVEGDCIRCFYHGWKYDATGQCVEQPAEDAAFAKKARVPGYPTEEYLGLIFAFLGEGEAPPLPRYPFLEDYPGDERLRIVHVDTRPYSYRNRIENSVDPVHVAFVHRKSEYGGLEECPEVSAEETDYGLILYSKRPNDQTRITQFQMPTILHIKQGPRYPEETGWRDFLGWRVPVDDPTNHLFDVTMVQITGEAARRFEEQEEERMARDVVPELGEAVLAGRLHIDEIEDLTVAVNLQDYVAQKGQGRIYDRTLERLGRSDVGVILLRQLYARELRALAEGRPLKEWRPLTPAATIGM